MLGHCILSLAKPTVAAYSSIHPMLEPFLTNVLRAIESKITYAVCSPLNLVKRSNQFELLYTNDCTFDVVCMQFVFSSAEMSFKTLSHQYTNINRIIFLDSDYFAKRESFGRIRDKK